MRIPIQNVDEQNIVYWESIEKVFPGVKCVKNGDVAYFPGAVLDVVLSSASEHGHDSSVGAPSMVPIIAPNSTLTVGRTGTAADPPTDRSSEDKFVEGLRVTSALAVTPINDIDTRSPSASPSILPPSLPSNVKISSKPALSFMQVVKLESKKVDESDGRVQQQELSAKIDHMIKSQEEMKQLQKVFDAKQEEMKQLALKHQEEIKQLQEASDAKQEEMRQLQEQALDRQEEMKQLAIDHHEEIKQLQTQGLGQLAVLQDRVKAVLTQTYELHEYPIPRLFVVLSQNPSRWDILDPFSNKFRLYFLCECGEHTKSIDSRMEIHFAKHEGYEITRPTEFFQLYGSHVFAILKMLKFGISVAGVAVPAISQLIHADVIDQANTYLPLLEDIEPTMDPVIEWMDKVSANEGEAVDEFTKQMEHKETLAGADLRKLDTFLKAKDGDKMLGNLYRTVTDEGHVKWVCIDHYRENYQESTAKDFQRMLDSVGGSFDKSIGRVEVRLRSRVLAEQFFSALEKARSVYELDIVLDWACTGVDVQALADALMKSVVSILYVDLQQFRPSLISKLSSIPTRYEVLYRIMNPPNMKSIHIVLPKDLIMLSNFTPRRPPHLHKLSFEMAVAPAFRIHAEMLETGSIATTLYLWDNSMGSNRAQALAQALKTSSTLTTLNVTDYFFSHKSPIRDSGAQALAEALKTNSTLTTLNLGSNSIGFDG
ncbi:hypothetical protein BGX24_005366, partial [Mortierella sp. AD032]